MKTDNQVNSRIANVPKLRFSGFNDNWNSVSLGEVCEVVMGQSPPSNMYTDDSNEAILIQGNADLDNGKVKPRIYTKKITKLSRKGDIILTVRAPVGDLAINEYNACIGRGVCSITTNSPKFIYYLLENAKQNHMWERLSQGSTFEAINSNDIKKFKIRIPSSKEQNKITSFLSSIDEKIDLLNQKLTQFKDFKKYLMQNIFAQKLRF